VTCTQPKHHKKRYIKLKNAIICARSGMTLSNFPNSSVKNVGIGTCAENCYTLQHVSSMKKEKTKNIKKKRGTKNEREKEKPTDEGKTEFKKNRELQKLDLLRTFHLGLNV
jgi:predicted lipoprotein with Yx(FWY)xxD motif